MRTKTILLALALGASTCLLSAQDTNTISQPPPQGGPGGHGGFHLLPPGAQESLNLTTNQQAQVTALEAETKVKLEGILTTNQIIKLKQMHPPRPSGGPGGSGDGSPPPGSN